jgi:hypothetical protein
VEEGQAQEDGHPEGQKKPRAGGLIDRKGEPGRGQEEEEEGEGHGTRRPLHGLMVPMRL